MRGFRDLGEDLGDGKAIWGAIELAMCTKISLGIYIPLSDDTSAHDKGTRLSNASVFVHFRSHARRIFKATLAGHGIGTTRVDDHGADPLTLTRIKNLLANLDWGCLELVGCEHSSGRTWCLGGDEGEVRKFSVGRFHADMCTGNGEPFGICAGSRDVLALASRKGNIHRCGVASHLAFRHPGESSHGCCGLGGRGHEAV